MIHHAVIARGVILLALTVGADSTSAATRVRDVPLRRTARVTLELQVVPDTIIVAPGASFVVPVRLRNVGSTARTLMFTSSCSFGIAIARADGREVARPRAMCLSVIREPTLEPGEVLDETVAYDTGEPGTVALEAGVYRVTPILLANSGRDVRVQSARLEVR